MGNFWQQYLWSSQPLKAELPRYHIQIHPLIYHYKSKRRFWEMVPFLHYYCAIFQGPKVVSEVKFSTNWGYFGLKMVMFFLVRPLPENHPVPTALANPATATTKPNLSTSETDQKTCIINCMQCLLFSCLKLVWKLKFYVVIVGRSFDIWDGTSV